MELARTGDAALPYRRRWTCVCGGVRIAVAADSQVAARGPILHRHERSVHDGGVRRNTGSTAGRIVLPRNVVSGFAAKRGRSSGNRAHRRRICFYSWRTTRVRVGAVAQYFRGGDRVYGSEGKDELGGGAV